MVVWGHSGPSICYTALYYVHLPIFIMLSGFLNEKSMNFKLKMEDIITKKLKGLIYPYLTFGFLVIFYHWMRYVITGSGFNLYGEFRLLWTLENGVCWFLPPLFFAEVLTLWFIKKGKNKINTKLFFLLLMIMFTIIAHFLLYNSPYFGKENAEFLGDFLYGILLIGGRIFSFAIFVLEGHFLYSAFLKIKGNKKLIGILCSLIFIIVFCITAKSKMVDLHFLKWENTFYYLFFSSCGASMFIISFALLYGKCSSLEWLGRNSLVIMVMHTNFQLISLGHKIYVTYGLNFSDTLHSLFIAVIGIVLSAIFVPVFTKAYPYVLSPNMLIMKKNNRRV